MEKLFSNSAAPAVIHKSSSEIIAANNMAAALHKPFDWQKLYSVIAKVLSSR